MSNWNEMLETGASARQVDTWTRKGFLELDGRQDGARQGTPRLWTRWALVKAQVMVRLTTAGIPAAIADALCEQTEVKEDILFGCKWVTATLGPGLSIRIEGLREDWQ